MKNRKEIKKRKRIKLNNKKLCKKYPWLIPNTHYFNGRILKKRDWNYSWTWWGDMPRGWRKCFGNMLLEELDIAIKKYNLTAQFGIDQIKEKYGRLTIYCHGFNDEISQIIDKYEYISLNVCVQCGAIDVPMVNDSWISPICFNCFKKHCHGQDKWYSKEYKDYKSRTDEEIWNLYKEFTSDEEEDWKICNSYTIRKWSKEETINITYNISDTVAKIRKRYEKK